ncbi:alkanesulfonate transporter substrate-binding subunit [compost metagenome]
MAEHLGYLAPLQLDFVGTTFSGPTSIQNTATGQTDFGWAFNGAILNLRANKANVKAIISYYGEDDQTFNGYYVLDESPIKNPKDLIGKKIGMNTLGGQSEFIIKDYLQQNGLTDDEIKQITLVVLPPANFEQALRQKQIDVVTLSGISKEIALERGGIRSLFNDTDLYGPLSLGSYVVTEKFLKNNPNTTRKFVEGVAKAIEWSKTTPKEQIIKELEKIIEKRGANESTAPLKYFKSFGVAGEGGVIAEQEFEIWYNFLIKSGQLKEGDIDIKDVYTNEFNPYSK